MDKNYKGIIWTNHALDRLKERGISQGDAWATFNSPDQSRYATSKGAWVYYKTYGSERLEVVAKKNEQNKWIVLTVWSRPVFEKVEHTHHKKSDSKRKPFLVRLFNWWINKKD